MYALYSVQNACREVYPFLATILPLQKSQKSRKPRQREYRLCQARVKERVKSQLCYVFTCLALKVPGKKSNPLNKTRQSQNPRQGK